MASRKRRRPEVTVNLDDPRQETPPKGVTKVGLLQSLGPGLVTGASDDDPSGIATYSQVGAQFGYGLLWTMLFSYPLMAAIQEISAQIGRVTGRGIAGNLRRHYAPGLALQHGRPDVDRQHHQSGRGHRRDGRCGEAADRRPGACCMRRCLPWLSVALESFLPYDKYAPVLKWMTLALVCLCRDGVCRPCAVGTRASRRRVVPHCPGKLIMSPASWPCWGRRSARILFFWQAEEEVEIERANPIEWPLRRCPKDASAQLHRIRVDTYTGMAFSNMRRVFYYSDGGGDAVGERPDRHPDVY